MYVKKKILLVLLSGMCAVFLCGCGNTLSKKEKKLHIGVTYYNQSDTFLTELLENFRKKVREYDKKGGEAIVTIRDAAGSQKTQDEQVKELLDAGCNILCVNLVDRSDPAEIIDRAKEYGVPIIFFNREPVKEDMDQWDELYYVGADAVESGVMQGELAAERIGKEPGIDRNKDGKIQYVILEGEAGHQDAIVRTENAVDTLKKKGIELERLSCQIANWNRAQAQNRMEQMLSKYHTDIELVLANNDDMALGAIDAYRKLNYTESALPVFFGVDGTDVGLKAVLSGELSGTVYNDKEGQAAAMAELAVALYTGKNKEGLKLVNGKYIYLPYSKVTADNAKEFIEEE